MRPSAFLKAGRDNTIKRKKKRATKDSQCDCNIMTQLTHEDCTNDNLTAVSIRRVSPVPEALYTVKAQDSSNYRNPTHLPKILELNRQVRSETKFLFFRENTFVWDHAELTDVKDWLFNFVGWEHMSEVRRLYCASSDNNSPSTADVVAYAVIILLMELRLLKCQLRVIYRLFCNDHIGCKLREKVRAHIQAHGILKQDVESKSAATLESIVSATAVAWRVDWVDDEREGNDEALLRCTVCELDELGELPDPPALESPAPQSKTVEDGEEA